MSLTCAHLDALLAAGATAEQLVALVKADMIERELIIAEKREKDAARQRKSRERHAESRDVTVTACDIVDSPAPLTPPLKVSPDPFKRTPPISPHPVRRGTRLPDDFKVPGEWIEWAMNKRDWTRQDAKDEADCFARYWQAKPGREAVKLDWFKTWQNWASNSRRTSSSDPPVWDGIA